MNELVNATGTVVTLSSKDVVRRIYRIEPSTEITLKRSGFSMKVFDGVGKDIPTTTVPIPDGYEDPDNFLEGDSPLLVNVEVAIYLRYNHPEFSEKQLYVADEPFRADTGEIVWYSKLLKF